MLCSLSEGLFTRRSAGTGGYGQGLACGVFQVRGGEGGKLSGTWSISVVTTVRANKRALVEVQRKYILVVELALHLVLGIQIGSDTVLDSQ